MDWTKFAFAALPAPAGAGDADDPDSTEGATDQAMQHLQAAYDHIQRTIANTRKMCMALKKHEKTSGAALGLMSKALEQAPMWGNHEHALHFLKHNLKNVGGC